MSSILLWRECQRSPPPMMTTEWKSVRVYPIPSIIYLIHNNVQFATLTYVDTSTYQIMGNLKIVTTAILFRFYSISWSLYWFGSNIVSALSCSFICFILWEINVDPYIYELADILILCFRLFLRRKLSNLQWMAIVLLAVGTTTSQVLLLSTFFFLHCK